MYHHATARRSEVSMKYVVKKRANYFLKATIACAVYTVKVSQK